MPVEKLELLQATFYIIPLQEALETSLLSLDSTHFSKMPKKTCYQCNEVMPLHMLAVHVKACKGKLSDDDGVDDDEGTFLLFNFFFKFTITWI